MQNKDAADSAHAAQNEQILESFLKMPAEEVLRINQERVKHFNSEFRSSPRVPTDRIELLRKEILSKESRSGFPNALNALGLLGEGAEVGVKFGKHAHYLRSHWAGKTLYLVDPYKHFNLNYKDKANVSDEEQEKIFAHARASLAPFTKSKQAIFCRGTSETVAKQWALQLNQGELNKLDFVYLDAQHHAAAVRKDIALWAPLIKSGGILAGHDFVFDPGGRINGSAFGVPIPVLQFVTANKLPLIITEEKFPSWFTIIPEA